MDFGGEKLEALIICISWILSKENPKALKRSDKTVDHIFNQIRNHNAVISILDKDVHVVRAKNLIKDFVREENFTDKTILEFLDLSLGEASKEEIELFTEILCIYINKDKKVSVYEHESIEILKNRYKIDDAFLNKCIVDTKNKRIRRKLYTHDVHHGMRWEYPARVLLLLIGIGALAFTGYSVFVFIKAKQEFAMFNMGDVIKNNPKLVFKRADFYKYIIIGTSDDANKYFSKLDLYHVKGSADFQFDMSGLVIDEDKTDYVCKVLCLRYEGKDGDNFPLEVDVNIAPEDIYPIPMEETPEAVSEKTAQTIGKVAAVPAALVGAVVGAKVGGLVGGSMVPFWGNIVGGGLGGLSGAGAAGYGTYVMTSTFFTGLRAKGLTLGQKDKIIESSKLLIALELMGRNFLSADSWAADVKKYYLDEFKATLCRLFGSYGWKEVKIENLDQ